MTKTRALIASILLTLTLAACADHPRHMIRIDCDNTADRYLCDDEGA